MKRPFVFLILLICIVVLVGANRFLWQLQEDKQADTAILLRQIAQFSKEKQRLEERNDALRLEVENLSSPDALISFEEKAREDFGMIGKNETYFVLSKKEYHHVPDIIGLTAEKTDYINYDSVLAKSIQQQVMVKEQKEEISNTIPVSPLKLESLP